MVMKKSKKIMKKTIAQTDNHQKSFFYECISFLTRLGYISVLVVFYGCFVSILLSMCRTVIGTILAFLCFFFIVVLPYIYIFKKKENLIVSIISNCLIILLAFWGVYPIIGLLLGFIFLPVHNLFMSMGYYLANCSVKNK